MSTEEISTTTESADLDPKNLTHVRLPVFEGPLDLLLYLIKKDELDIYDIPIERITTQYLEYLKIIKMLDLEVAGDYLVVAATLVYIKSRTILPHDQRPPEDEAEEDDPRWELVRQLVEYKKYKDAAFELQHCLERQEGVRGKGTTTKPDALPDGSLPFDKVGLFDPPRRLPEGARPRQHQRGPQGHLRGPLHCQRQDPVHPGRNRQPPAHRLRSALRRRRHPQPRSS